jgi:hypothetical protein
VAAGAPRLRLPIGADAVKNIRAKLAQVASEVERGESGGVFWARFGKPSRRMSQCFMKALLAAGLL